MGQHGSEFRNTQNAHQRDAEQHDAPAAQPHDAPALADGGVEILDQVDLFGERLAHRCSDGAQFGKEPRVRLRVGSFSGRSEVLDCRQDGEKDDGCPGQAEDRDPQVEPMQIGPLQVWDCQ